MADIKELLRLNGAQLKENGERHDRRLAVIETKMGGMHDIVCEADENKFPKIRVMEKKVKEIWNKVIKGTDD
jgi:hypothetical protein